MNCSNPQSDTNPLQPWPNTEGSHRYTVSVNNSLAAPQVTGHSLPLNAASSWMPNCVREICSRHTICQIIKFSSACPRVLGTIPMTSFPCEPTAALSVITYLIITTDRICIPKDRKEGIRDISEHLVRRRVFLEC